jgi:hypothetical protein
MISLTRVLFVCEASLSALTSVTAPKTSAHNYLISYTSYCFRCLAINRNIGITNEIFSSANNI